MKGVFVKGRFVKGGFVKRRFVKGRFVKHGFLKGRFVKHGFLKQFKIKARDENSTDVFFRADQIGNRVIKAKDCGT